MAAFYGYKTFGVTRRKRTSGPWKYGPPAKRTRRFAVAAPYQRRKVMNARTAGFLGLENKFYDTGIENTALVATTSGAMMDPTPTVLCLNAVPQGDGESNRDGRKIVINSIRVKGSVSGTTRAALGAMPAGLSYRLILVQDTQTNGAQCSSAQVLQDNTLGEDWQSFKNLEYEKRFKILRDITDVVNVTATIPDGTNTGSVGYGTKNFDIYLKCDIPVIFTGTTEAIANVVDNSLHVIAIGQSANMNMSYQSRIRYRG